MFVKDPSSLAELVAELRDAGSFALDTEFIREHTYRPRLFLVQVATAEKQALVDPLVLDDLRPFLELIGDPRVEKIVHSGDQDMEIFVSLGSPIPRNIFDTQVAAALAGRGNSISYGRLVEDVCGVRLEKGETYTDWARRPLRPQQIEYALNDVRYLIRVADELRRQLADLGRLDWLPEELAFHEDPATYAKEPRRAYLRVRGGLRLDRVELAVLRELAAWREETAAEIDRPKHRIVTDEMLVELARRSPSTIDSIAEIRGVQPQLLRRFGRDILRSVATAKGLSPADYPPPIERSLETPEIAAAVDVLEVALRIRASEQRVASQYLGARKDLVELVLRQGSDQGPEGEPSGTPRILTGWRRRIVGETLLQVLRGGLVLAIDPKTSKAVLVPR